MKPFGKIAVPLAGVARPAKQLEVGRNIAPAFGDSDHVVDFELLPLSASGAAAVLLGEQEFKIGPSDNPSHSLLSRSAVDLADAPDRMGAFRVALLPRLDRIARFLRVFGSAKPAVLTHVLSIVSSPLGVFCGFGGFIAGRPLSRSLPMRFRVLKAPAIPGRLPLGRSLRSLGDLAALVFLSLLRMRFEPLSALRYASSLVVRISSHSRGEVRLVLDLGADAALTADRVPFPQMSVLARNIALVALKSLRQSFFLRQTPPLSPLAGGCFAA